MSVVQSRHYPYSPAPERVVALVNPRSGNGGGLQVLRLLRTHHWSATITSFETIPNSLSNHYEAVEYAHRTQADRLLVAGGDGTLMETLTVQREMGISIPICMIPVGTGNIVASDLAAPRRIYPAVRQAFSPGILHHWDAGFLPQTRQVFALRASAGFEAAVISTMNTAAKQRWGVMAYAMPALREFLRATPVQFNLTIDDAPMFTMEGIVAFVAVTNRITSVFNFVISRDIHPDDGILHLGIFHPRKLLQNLPAMLNQAALQARDMISLYPVKNRVIIESDTPQITQVDGEKLGITPLVVETLPKAVPFIVPLVPRRRLRFRARPIRTS